MAAKKTAKKGTQTGSSAFELILSFLRKKRGASFAEVRDAAAKKGHKIYPISYGRAQSLLGIVKSSPRGQGKSAKQQRKAAGVRKGRGPGRPRKDATGLGALEDVIRSVQQNHAEVQRYRDALQRISDIIHDAL